MKRKNLFVLTMLFAALTIVLPVQAQKTKARQQKQLVTVVYQTDIHCDGCARKIMNNVPALGRGVEDVRVDVPTKQVTVTYDAQKTGDDKIIAGLKSIAVNAVRADK